MQKILELKLTLSCKIYITLQKQNMQDAFRKTGSSRMGMPDGF